MPQIADASHSVGTRAANLANRAFRPVTRHCSGGTGMLWKRLIWAPAGQGAGADPGADPAMAGLVLRIAVAATMNVAGDCTLPAMDAGAAGELNSQYLVEIP